MRSLSRALLLALAFAIPWQYSLDLGPPLGNIARILGLLLLLVAFVSVIPQGFFRSPAPLQWISLVLFLWLCSTALWTLDRGGTLRHIRGYAQGIFIAWIVWEFIDTPRQLRQLIGAYVAGAGALAVLTVAVFAFASHPDQARFVAPGQDPNDAARFLVLALPLFALLLRSELRWSRRIPLGAFLPVCTLAVLLTASRSGLFALLLALAGSSLLLVRAPRRGAWAALAGIPAALLVSWLALPRQTLGRLATSADELHSGLNQRWNIWLAGWHAFVRAPFFGSGVGSFVLAARLAPADTAHNTALAFAVEGGLVALGIAVALLVACIACVVRTRGPVRIALGTMFAALMLSSLIATVQENRATWLLLGILSVAARLAEEQEHDVAAALQPIRGVPVPSGVSAAMTKG